MSRVIAQKDLLVLRRQSLLKILLPVILVLLVVSLATAVHREQVFEKEKDAAQITDKAVWMEQGDRNPHSAAHFSRYAFRPSASLAAFDPGISDFAGLAVWLEAHYQDPAVFRRAEDGGELSRYAQLTPAFVLLVAAPLLIFLMMSGSVAGEREDGTLRQLLAVGIRPAKFFLGKFGAGIRASLWVFALSFIGLTVIAWATGTVALDADTSSRLVGLFLLYSIYLATCVAIALGVSALFRTRQTAFLCLAGVWLVTTLLLPRLAADVATGIYPQPDPRQVTQQLRAASYSYYDDERRQQQIEKDLLDKHAVESSEELPFNYGAYQLQASEDLSVVEFDRVYADLESRYAKQDAAARWFSVLTPAIAASALSRGIAGTDRAHQQAFTNAAELHRREMIKMLNEDYMYNAGEAGAAYTANAALWSKFEDFRHNPPRLSEVSVHYLKDALVSLAWLAISLILAYTMVVRAVRQEVPTA